MKNLTPVRITQNTMDHIQSHPGRGHIKEHEIREALVNRNELLRNANEQRGDVIVRGQAHNGKRLEVYVKFINDEYYVTEVCSARDMK